MTVQAGIKAPEWDDALEDLPRGTRDFYLTSSYHRLHEVNGEGRPFYSVIREGAHSLLIAGLRSRIPGPGDGGPEYSDMESCNGYGGPLATPDAPREFLDQAWRGWKDACRREGIIAGFFRMHPLISNENFLPGDAEMRFDRRTVFANLEKGTEPLWRSATPQHRNMISKGRREGAAIRWNEPEDWEEFIPLYSSAMARLNAPARLRFSPEYFAALRALPGIEWAGIRGKASLDAAAVFLRGDVWSHYHLSARSEHAPNYVMNCLVQAAFERAAGQGQRGLHLGGGKTASPDDSLLRFKMSTGGSLLDFNVALVVADRPAYERLCENWSRRAGTRPNWLLGYRQPLPVKEC